MEATGRLRVASSRGGAGVTSRSRRLAFAAARAGIVVVLALALVVTHELRVARHAAQAGEHALLAVNANMQAGRPLAARRAARRAREHFARARARIGGLRARLSGLPASGALDDQLRAVDTLAAAGALVAGAADALAASAAELADATPARLDVSRRPAADRIAASTAASAGAARPRRARRPMPDGTRLLTGLRAVRGALTSALATVQTAAARVDALRETALLGPVAAAGDRAHRRLGRARAQAAAGVHAVSALIAFAGGGGPRRYLVLSQNPAELRPTGGFIGTYGVVTARDGRVRLERYRSIESWYFPRRHAVVAPDRAPRALRLPRRPVPQTIANVNATADWPAAARLAARLWRAGGEAPVDGVLSFTPELVARALRVVGPLRVRGRTVGAGNLLALLDEETHSGARARRIDRRPFGSLAAASRRKRFVALLAGRVMRALTRSSRRLPALAAALAAGLDAREGMAWSTDPALAHVLRARHWDGRLPRGRGDFFFDGEFQYAVKNGRGLRRTFDHDVVLRADGSARVTTTITIANTQSNGMASHAYMTLYGPAGAALAPGTDPPVAEEPALSGHPAAGWLRTTPSWGRTRVRVAWDVPDMLVRGRDGRVRYRLHWMRVPGHGGDTLRLRVTPPAGWRWTAGAPPRAARLTRDLQGAWPLAQ